MYCQLIDAIQQTMSEKDLTFVSITIPSIPNPSIIIQLMMTIQIPVQLVASILPISLKLLILKKANFCQAQIVFLTLHNSYVRLSLESESKETKTDTLLQ